jgi:hypothetical protein
MVLSSLGEIGRARREADRKALGILAAKTNTSPGNVRMARTGSTEAPELPFATAFAFFRICAIMQALRGFPDGNAPTPEAALKMGERGSSSAKPPRQRSGN